MNLNYILELRETLKTKLKPSRYEHTLSVSYTAMCLAMRYGCDIGKAELAGLLHDCARQYSKDEILERCLRHGIEVTEEEKANPVLLHAKLGAWMAVHKYQVDDEDVANAVRYHTTGRPGMSLLEKIIYLADYIEPRREKAPDLPAVRPLAFQDIDECVYVVMEGILHYLEDSKSVIDTATREACEYYREIHDRKQAGAANK